MATNKRKDAAALFELIDKSTLKVPKNAGGALKIPSWWSSKSNPPSKISGTAAAVPPAAAPRAASSAGVSSGAPPASVAPATLAAPVASGAPAVSAAPPASTVAPPPRPPALPIKSPVYMPQTVNPASIAPGGGQRRVSGTPVPLWAAVVGGTLVILIVIAAIMVAVRPRPSSVANTNNHPAPLAGPGSTSNITPYDPAKDPNANSGQFNAPPVQRDPKLLYLVVVLYPRQDMAEQAARGLHDHGVAVTVEHIKQSYYLISVRGFAKESSEAEAFRRQVIEIGREQSGGRKRKVSVFNSAYFTPISYGTTR